jgi:hypothetical protein
MVHYLKTLNAVVVFDVGVRILLHYSLLQQKNKKKKKNKNKNKNYKIK